MVELSVCCTAVLKKNSEKEELGKKQQDEGKIADEINVTQRDDSIKEDDTLIFTQEK